MPRTPALELLESNPRVFWGHVIRVLIERGWTPPRPDERIVDELVNAIDGIEHAGTGATLERVPETLSPREVEVLTLVRRGLENHEIADELAIATQTVKFHLANAYHKLGVRNRVEAVLMLEGIDRAA